MRFNFATVFISSIAVLNLGLAVANAATQPLNVLDANVHSPEPKLKVANPENNEEGQVPSTGVPIESSSSNLKLPSWFENPSLVAGLKSFNDSGRLTALQNGDANPRAKTYYAKNELYLGVKAQSGWGMFGQFVEEVRQYNTYANSSVTAGDPSLTLTHPTLYKDDQLSINGQLRQYFQGSEYAIRKNVVQTAYYSFLNLKLKHGYDVGNTFIARNFGQPSYGPTDTKFLTEDYSSFARNISTWFRLGLGQHTQVEYHPISQAGTCVEVFPYADFMLSKTVFFGPRIYMPVYVDGSVYDAPKFTSTTQMMGELYFQATL